MNTTKLQKFLPYKFTAVEKEDYIREIERQYEGKITTGSVFVDKLAHKNQPV